MVEFMVRNYLWYNLSSLQIVNKIFILQRVTIWLTERGYSEKLVSKEALKPKIQSRETLVDKEKMSRNDERVTFR